MRNIWLTSDLHFCHNREFLYGPRGFTNPWDMNEAIVKNWNEIIQSGDDVYLLGDIMLNDNETGLKLLKSLKGNIHIILGNHDTDTRIALYKDCWNVVEVTYATKLDVNGYHFFLTHYGCQTSNFDLDKPLKQRLISLCGHTHTKDRWLDWKEHPIYHVELDAHNNAPVHIETIIYDITHI